MKKTIPIFFILFALFTGCTKEHLINPAPQKLVTVSLHPNYLVLPPSNWQQVLGGSASLKLTPQNSDSVTLSSISTSINLKDAASYKQQVIAGTYDITLNTQSTAVADTFIRFTSKADHVPVNKDETIDLAATTTDGVITISTKLIDSTVTPTFKVGNQTAYNLGKTNGYYFLYVKDATGGTITFSLSNGYQYMKDLTDRAMNQYDLIPLSNSYGELSIKSYPFNTISSTKISIN
ncbi:hypothetical protein SAMN05192574_107130 [Mucilaginibacter gossypiicola]|uniref:Uncharacterized protein n=1 Tax=Mucilaginibacter gossypiicola TaxID=551995 RepID=A0A1H8NWI4_9SPHI|nr:hypothetical protein [Mucilaginibacter gossypiicola]SEO34026.1 hypothetical protein SAMN05192574_107130 [Mucilaginibacter gossypiicola]